MSAREIIEEMMGRKGRSVKNGGRGKHGSIGQWILSA